MIKKMLTTIAALVMALSLSVAAYAGLDANGWFTTRGNAPIPAFGLPDDPAVRAYWDQRHTFEQLETLFKHLQAAYPETVKLYPIGHTWEERLIWCLEISKDGKSDGKTPVAIVGSIRGNEQESAECAAYAAWWLAAGYDAGINAGAGGAAGIVEGASAKPTAASASSGAAAASTAATTSSTSAAAASTATSASAAASVAAAAASAADALDGYVWYIVPVVNADGYARSMYCATRTNIRPRGMGLDEYFDRNGDGKVGQMFAASGSANAPYGGGTPNTSYWAADFETGQITDDACNYLGYESFDTNSDGRFGNGTKQSGVDLSRNFDFMWSYYRPANPSSEAAGYFQLGAAGSWNDDPGLRAAGPYPASEPETRAVQNFFTYNPPVAMITAGTGSQSVLYPWCYSPNPTADQDAMSAAAEKMRLAFQNTVQAARPLAHYYQMNSYADYPTQGELIDWIYGRLGTHAYAVNVYSRGAGNAAAGANWDDIDWWSANFTARWKYLGQIKDERAGLNRRTYDNVWIYYSAVQMRCGEAPPDQRVMAEGFKDCALAMAFGEPRDTPHPGAPIWMTWGMPQQNPAAPAVPSLCAHGGAKHEIARLEPTCDETGIKDIYCSICYKQLYVNITIPKLKHNLTILRVVEPTATKGGCTIYKCLLCGLEMEDNFLPPLVPFKSDADFLHEKAADILKYGLDQSNLRLEDNVLTLILDGREFVLDDNAFSRNASGEISLGEGYYLAFDIRGNGSDVAKFAVIYK